MGGLPDIEATEVTTCEAADPTGARRGTTGVIEGVGNLEIVGLRALDRYECRVGTRWSLPVDVGVDEDQVATCGTAVVAGAGVDLYVEMVAGL